jgi:hypothetical protein
MKKLTLFLTPVCQNNRSQAWCLRLTKGRRLSPVSNQPDGKSTRAGGGQ